MVGKIEGSREERVTEDGTVRWHHRSMDINLGELQEMGRDREAGVRSPRVVESLAQFGD